MSFPDDDFLDILRRSRILIVDDEMDICDLMRRKFQVEEYTHIDVEVDGRKAFQRITKAATDKEPYDLVILDLCLPGEMSGQDVYAALCDTVDVPVVIVSAVAQDREILSALKTSVVEEYLVKPINLDVLFVKCERVLSRRVFNRHLQKSHRRNQALFLNILQVMAKVLEAKDPYTKFHSEKVAKYSRQIGKRLGYSERQLELIQIAGILHDFGKIGIKESVLNKPGSLSKFEYETVKRHPLIASAILEPIEELRVIIRDIRHHHEWWNGQGYPDGLTGEEIPLGARILSVADSFDAMTSSRSYHEPMTEEDAQEELLRCKEQQFDPEVVDVFMLVLEESRQRRERIARLREEIL